MRRCGRLSHPAAARRFEARLFPLVAYVPFLSVNIHDALFGPCDQQGAIRSRRMLSGKTRVSETVTGDAARAIVANTVSEMAREAAEESILQPMSYVMSFLQPAAKQRSRPKKIDGRPQTRTGWLSNFQVTSLFPQKYSGVLLPTQHRRRGGRPPSRFALFTRQGWQTNPRVPGIRHWLHWQDSSFERCRSIAPCSPPAKKSGQGGGTVGRLSWVQADL
jgi:hypothetical protein